jgi:holo-[acyl-carrier protein] synthase
MVVGSGVDVIEIARVARAIERRGERFERRVFSGREIADCRRTSRPADQFALRFAVKEATMKALGTGWARGVRFVDIESAARSGRGGRMEVELHGCSAATARSLGAVRHHVAATHDRTHAFALVLLEADD